MKRADYVLKSKAIFTATSDQPLEGAIAVAGNQILALGTTEEMEEYVSAETKVIDYGNRLIMPGFNDSHMHFSLGAVQNDPDFCILLMDAKSEEECVERVRIFAESHPDNEWIYGFGFYSDMWDEPHTPSLKTLDALKLGRPVCINSFDLHCVWCNSEALEKVGITKDTPDPFGGVIGHDEQGELDGMLYEPAANGKMMDMALNVPTLKESLDKCLKRFRELGITAIADVYPPGVTNDNVYETFEKLNAEQKLTCRISCFPDLRDVPKAKELKEKYHTDKIRIAGVKQLLDGIVEANTAYMSEPYLNNPDSRGEAAFTQEELNQMILEAHKNGFPVKVHTIGDAACTMAINAFEKAVKAVPEQKLAHSLEHIETIKYEDIKRMKELNLISAVQPQHTSGGLDGGGYHVCLGEEKVKDLWPFREALDEGVTLAFSTDFPAVYSLNPIWTIYGAVTRSNPDTGNPKEGYFREHATTLAEAITAHTRGSACAESFEEKVGTLEVGKLADLIVIDRNLFEIDPMDIRFAKVDMTMFDGKIVFER